MVKAFIRKKALNFILLRGPSMPSTVAIMMSKLLSSAYMDEKSLSKNGDKLKMVLVAVTGKLVCKLAVVVPLKVTKVYLLYASAASMVTASADNEAADSLSVRVLPTSLILGLIMMYIPQLSTTFVALERVLVTSA